MPCFFVQAIADEEIAKARERQRQAQRINEQLFKALRAKNMQEARRLIIEEGADPKAKEKFSGYSTLHLVDGYPDMARFLIERGVDPDAKDAQREAPLFGIQDADTVRVFIEGGADPNIRGIYGGVPLHTGGPDNIERAKALIEGGANPNAINDYGIASVIAKHPFLVSRELRETTSCRYTANSFLINPTQCGRRNVCMAEVSCQFNVGYEPNKVQVDKRFQAVCTALSNGQCPSAKDCVLDRSVVERQLDDHKNINIIPSPSPAERRRRARHGRSRSSSGVQ